MKFKDFFTKLKTDGKINNPKFDAAIEGAPDIELDDEAVKAFESAFLTIDRAATHKEVHGKLKREFLDPFDNDLKKILSIIGGIDKSKSDEIEKISSTYEKFAAITTTIPQLIEKVKATPATDQETKDKLTQAEQTVQNLMKKIEGMNTEFVSKEKHIKKEAETQINNYKLNGYLEKMANSFKFGKAYTDSAIRKDLTKVKLDNIRASHNLSYVEKDGQETVTVLDENGQPRFLNNGNTPLTINHLLEEAFKPYIKASNTDDPDDEPEQPNPQATRFQVKDKGIKPRQGSRTTVQ